jgi:hypothetical protein
MDTPLVRVIAQVAVTLVLVGLILTVQLVHYPLFARVGAPGFAAYEAEHSSRITWLVLPLMFSELALASWLAFATPPALPRWSAWLGLGLVVLIWLSTFFVQVPQHAILGRGWDARAHAVLVATNWIRTVAWIARGGLGVWWLFALAAR